MRLDYGNVLFRVGIEPPHSDSNQHNVKFTLGRPVATIVDRGSSRLPARSSMG
jgi:hypothetical protein